MNRIARISSFVLLLVVGVLSNALAPLSSDAHQPRLAIGGTQITVENAMLSQAFYGRTPKGTVTYTLNEQEPFELFVQVLVPDQSGVQTQLDLSVVKINVDGTTTPVSTIVRGSEMTWTRFYEPFGMDAYLQGPSIRQSVDAGTYSVRVTSVQEGEPYVFVVGEKEFFTAREFREAMRMLPEIKREVFGLTGISVYINGFTLFFAGIVLVIIVIVIIAVVVKRSRRKKSTMNS